MEGLILIIPMVASIFCVVAYERFVEDLELSQIFFILILFNQFVFPIQQLYFGATSFQSANISLDRLEKFTKLIDADKDNSDLINPNLAVGELRISNGFFTYYNAKFSK